MNIKPAYPGHHPLIYWLDKELAAQKRSMRGVSVEAGLCDSAVQRWRLGGSTPSIANFDAVRNVLGYRLTVEKINQEPT